MKNVDNFRKAIKYLVTEQINTDRCLVGELADIESSLKKLDKNYRALINNSFSRVVLDDGKNGTMFDIQLYPVGQQQVDGGFIYDMRGYFHNSDRVYKKSLKLEDVKEFINKEMKKYLGEDGAYQRKSLKKGKRPYWDSEDYKYNTDNVVKTPDTDKMEEVKNFKKQMEYTPEDLADRKLEEMGIGIGLDELAEKIENSIWGAIKREGESTHQKTAKASHDVKDTTTALNKHILTKSKLRKAKTNRIQEKSKGAEHSKNITVTPSKVGTPKVKDFTDDKRKAVNESKKKSLTEFRDMATVISPVAVEEKFKQILGGINVVGRNKTGYKELFFIQHGDEFDAHEDEDGSITYAIFPEITFAVDIPVDPTDENIAQVRKYFESSLGPDNLDVHESYDSANNTSWVGVIVNLNGIEVSVNNLERYFNFMITWCQAILNIMVRLGLQHKKKTVSEGFFDRLKANVKGGVKGFKDAAKHNLGKWKSSGDAIKAKASGDTDALKRARSKEKEFVDKERYRSGGKTGKRSIFKTAKEKEMAPILMDAYSKRINKRLNNFKMDMSSSFGVEKEKIVPFLNGIGLTTQATALAQLVKSIKAMKQLGMSNNITEGMWNRAVASSKGIGSGLSTIKQNLGGRDSDIKDPKVQFKIKKAETIFNQFRNGLHKTVSNMEQDFEKINFDNKTFKSIPVRIRRLVDLLNVK